MSTTAPPDNTDGSSRKKGRAFALPFCFNPHRLAPRVVTQAREDARERERSRIRVNARPTPSTVLLTSSCDALKFETLMRIARRPSMVVPEKNEEPSLAIATI